MNLVQSWDQPDSTSLPPPYPRAPLVQPVTQSPQADIPLRSPFSVARACRGKQGPRKIPQRGPSYTHAKDKALCSAYLNVSRDPIVGANQTSDTYWDRICKYYHDNNELTTHRTIDSLQHRWGTISKDTTCFCGFKAEQDRRRESGKTEDDRVSTQTNSVPVFKLHSF